MNQQMNVAGYEKLAGVLVQAYNQAAIGKGKERHANGKPFHEQPMLSISRTLGSIDGLLYQASKKSAESRVLPTKERALAEIYGAINYLAGAAILINEGLLHGKSEVNAVGDVLQKSQQAPIVAAGIYELIKPRPVPQNHIFASPWVNILGDQRPSELTDEQLVRVKYRSGGEGLSTSGEVNWRGVVAYQVFSLG